MSYLRVVRIAKHLPTCSTFCCPAPIPIFNTRNNNREKCFSMQSSFESVLKTQSGIFQTISESTPVAYLQNVAIDLHQVAGLPWWGTVICTTLLLRSTVTLPFAIYQNYIMGKIHNIRLELMEIANELKKETAVAIKLFKWDERTAKYNYRRSLKKQWKILVVRENCHPLKAVLLIWFQFPLWICFSVALRNLVYMLPNMDANAQITFYELAVGGFGWIHNLTQADPLLILPITLGIVNLANIEMQVLSRPGIPTKFQRYLTNFLRGVTLIMVPVTAYVPSCLALYWTTSSVFGLIQNLVLMSPKVKRFCRVPQTSIEIEKPYSHIFNGLKRKLNLSGVSQIS